MLTEKSINNEDLANLKAFFNKSPLDGADELLALESKKDGLLTEEKDSNENLFASREHYQTYPRGLPIFLKSVKWYRPV